MDKIAFITSGGGMACAYSAGVAWALQDLGIKPDIFIGSSGSAGTVSYFACGQAGLAARLWVEEVSSAKVIRDNPLYFDIDFIVDSMKEFFPFEESKLHEKNIDLFLTTTDYETGKLKFFNNHDDVDWYEVIRASMAVPLIYNKKIIIKNKKYIDGDLSSTINDCVGLAISKGATQIYICDTTPRLNLKLLRVFPFSAILTAEFLYFIKLSIRKHLRLPKSYTIPKITIFRPSKKLLLDVVNNKQADIKEKIDAGYKETVSLLGKIK